MSVCGTSFSEVTHILKLFDVQFERAISRYSEALRAIAAPAPDVESHLLTCRSQAFVGYACCWTWTIHDVQLMETLALLLVSMVPLAVGQATLEKAQAFGASRIGPCPSLR